MLTVTPMALERLSQKLARTGAAEDVALRFKRSKGRWQLREDRARPEDATFAHQGRNVLLLDQAVSEAMSRMALDVRQTEAGPRLKLSRNPANKD